jgi:hypothetical protein
VSANDGIANDGLGWSIALDGNTAVIGAPNAMVNGHSHRHTNSHSDTNPNSDADRHSEIYTHTEARPTPPPRPTPPRALGL